MFVSDNDGPYVLFQDDTTTTLANFTGQRGHTYRFYSVASDNVGHVEAAPVSADATTVIDVPVQPNFLLSAISGPGVAVPGQLRSYSATFSDGGTGGSYTATIDWGDGTTSPGYVATTSSGGATNGALSFWHTYATFGDRVVRLTLRNGNSSVGTAEQAVTVQLVTFQADPLDPAPRHWSSADSIAPQTRSCLSQPRVERRTACGSAITATASVPLRSTARSWHLAKEATM